MIGSVLLDGLGDGLGDSDYFHSNLKEEPYRKDVLLKVFDL
jgi:hypothetical protein